VFGFLNRIPHLKDAVKFAVRISENRLNDIRNIDIWNSARRGGKCAARIICAIKGANGLFLTIHVLIVSICAGQTLDINAVKFAVIPGDQYMLIPR